MSTEVEAAVTLGRTMSAPAVIDMPDAEIMAAVHDVPRVLVAHKDSMVHDLTKMIEPRLLRPHRSIGTTTLQSLDSLIAHIRRHHLPDRNDTVLYFNTAPDAESITAIYDATVNAVVAGHQQHRATFALEYTEPWKAWMEIDGKGMNTAQFAEFLDERIGDVYEGTPSPSQAEVVDRLALRLAGISALVTLSRGLAVNASVKVKNAVTTSTGEISMQYEESHTDGRGEPIKIANAFLLVLPVFVGTAPTVCMARLSYRVTGGLVTWKVQIHDLDRIHEYAVKAAKQALYDALPGIPVFDGIPSK